MKTAVEWLVEELPKGYFDYQQNAIKQALEMEKEQIINAVEWGNRKGYEEHTLTCIYDEDLKYYNKTYKK